ncbi:MAG: AI-2E family transporter [Candidatus Koribacter versatilis]|uniref:AI-2E family transporter n=1 Tax=Candidatus Korobacter versatilis TaxID=658062 RepID=A0A932A830_9BACT|nr:AI-2E family transporter [Candidatus Koribacter versatilis]
MLGVEPEQAGELRPLLGASAARHIERSTGTQAAANVLLATIAVFAVAYLAKLVLVTLLLSVLLAFMLEPAVSLLERTRMPRAVATGIVMLVIAILLYLGGYYIYGKTMAFIDELPKYSQKVRKIADEYREKAKKLEQTTASVAPVPPPDKNTVKVQQETNWTEYVTGSLGSVTETVLAVSFIPFLVFFMLTWQEHVRAATVMLFKMENRNTAYVTLGRISKMIKAFMLGNLLIGLFTSVLSIIVFFLIGLPNAFVLGFLSGFLSLVPYLGVVLAMVPPLIAALGQETTPEILVIVLTILGLHLFAINVLYPKVLGRRLQLNPLAVTIALLLWGWLWGAWGLILAIPLTAAMKILFDHIEALQPYGAWMGE